MYIITGQLAPWFILSLFFFFFFFFFFYFRVHTKGILLLEKSARFFARFVRKLHIYKKTKLFKKARLDFENKRKNYIFLYCHRKSIYHKNFSFLSKLDMPQILIARFDDTDTKFNKSV